MTKLSLLATAALVGTLAFSAPVLAEEAKAPAKTETAPAAVQPAAAATEATYKEIDAKGLKALIDEKKPVVVLDSNHKDTYEEGHLPGATHITPRKATEKNLTKVAPAKDSMLVFYCGGPSCGASAKAAKKALKLGYTNVYKFPGGLEEWKKEGFPLEKKS